MEESFGQGGLGAPERSPRAPPRSTPGLPLRTSRRSGAPALGARRLGPGFGAPGSGAQRRRRRLGGAHGRASLGVWQRRRTARLRLLFTNPNSTERQKNKKIKKLERKKKGGIPRRPPEAHDASQESARARKSAPGQVGETRPASEGTRCQPAWHPRGLWLAPPRPRIRPRTPSPNSGSSWARLAPSL